VISVWVGKITNHSVTGVDMGLMFSSSRDEKSVAVGVGLGLTVNYQFNLAIKHNTPLVPV